MHYLKETRKQDSSSLEMWKCGHTAGGEFKESRKAVPVPDQKGEEEGGTKLQPPGETTEKRSEWWEGVQAVVGAKREHKQSKHKFDRKRACLCEGKGERKSKSCQSQSTSKKANKVGDTQWERRAKQWNHQTNCYCPGHMHKILHSTNRSKVG